MKYNSSVEMTLKTALGYELMHVQLLLTKMLEEESEHSDDVLQAVTQYLKARIASL